MFSHKLLIHSARQIVQVVNNGEKALFGSHMNNIAVLNTENVTTGFSIAVGNDGNISAIGSDEEVKNLSHLWTFEKVVDASDKCLVPGLVDGHTHAVWAGDRVHEFAMKLAGATYMDVHAAGGGINYTVDHVRQATEEELYRNLAHYVQRMLEAGTTLVECKSGYGLDSRNEIKMLKVIERAKNSLPIEISSTYCGAHSVPKGSTAEEATQDIINVQLPRLRELMQTGELHVDNIDVFCEKGVFSVPQTRLILEEGCKLGLAINFHGEELNQLNSAEMGAALKARAISHLEEISEAGIEAMAEAGSIGVILPTTAYILHLKPPPVRRMIQKGMAVALGSDFNPNAHCVSMPLVMHLACVLLGMSMNEALSAATINAAASLGKSHSHGSLEVGKVASILILNANRWEHLIYQLGGHSHVISHVISKGNVVHENKESNSI